MVGAIVLVVAAEAKEVVAVVAGRECRFFRLALLSSPVAVILLL